MAKIAITALLSGHRTSLFYHDDADAITKRAAQLNLDGVAALRIAAATPRSRGVAAYRAIIGERSIYAWHDAAMLFAATRRSMRFGA